MTDKKHRTHVSRVPKRGFRPWRAADGETIHVREGYVLKPCTGEAHGNPFIDHCGVCMKGVWGWAPSKVGMEEP